MKIHRLNNVAVIDNLHFPLGFVISYNDTTEDITISSIHYPFSKTFKVADVEDYQNRTFSSSGRLLEYLCFVLNDDKKSHFKTAESQHTFAIACNSTAITYAVMGVRKNDSTTVSAFIKSFGGIITATADAGILKIVRNPTFASGSFVYANIKQLDFAVGNGTQQIIEGTGHTLFCACVSQQNGFVECDLEILNDNNYVLCYRPITATQSLAFLLNCYTDSSKL